MKFHQPITATAWQNSSCVSHRQLTDLLSDNQLVAVTNCWVGTIVLKHFEWTRRIAVCKWFHWNNNQLNGQPKLQLDWWNTAICFLFEVWGEFRRFVDSNSDNQYYDRCSKNPATTCLLHWYVVIVFKYLIAKLLRSCLKGFAVAL